MMKNNYATRSQAWKDLISKIEALKPRGKVGSHVRNRVFKVAMDTIKSTASQDISLVLFEEHIMNERKTKAQ